MGECIFCQIVKKEIEAPIIFEDSHCMVIPDKFPTYSGQCLVILKEHVPYFIKMEDGSYHHIFMIARKIAQVIDAQYRPEKVCLVVEGFEVPHVHIKLYPVPDKHLVLSGGHVVDDKTLQEVADTLRNNL